MRPILTVICCTIFSIAPFAAAQPAATTPPPTPPTPPAAAPAVGMATTTMPATTQSVAVDQTTPRGALKVLTVAISRGDGTNIQSVLTTANPNEQKMVDALVAQQQSLAKFREAATTAYGVDESHKLTGDVEAAQADSLAALDRVPENVTGDTATVGDGDQLLKLTKTNGKWTMAVTTIIPQLDAATMTKELSMMSDRTKLFVDSAAEIAAGKYKTADDAGRALQLKLAQQAMTQGAAATQPGAAPTTAPAVPPTN